MINFNLIGVDLNPSQDSKFKICQIELFQTSCLFLSFFFSSLFTSLIFPMGRFLFLSSPLAHTGLSSFPWRGPYCLPAHPAAPPFLSPRLGHLSAQPAARLGRWHARARRRPRPCTLSSQPFAATRVIQPPDQAPPLSSLLSPAASEDAAHRRPSLP